MLTPTALLLHLGFVLLIAAVVAPRLELARAADRRRGPGLARPGGAGRRHGRPRPGAARSPASPDPRRPPPVEDSNVRFSADEQQWSRACSTGCRKSRARHLVDQGIWLSGKAGDVLTREGEPVDHLYYLAEGEARVLSTGIEVGLCRPGDLIGELTVLSGETASATVILNTPARFWCAPAEDLRPYVETHEDIRRAIEHGFATVLKAKLRASNRAIAEAAGATP